MGDVSAEIFTDIMKALKRVVYFLLTAFELADFVNKPDRRYFNILLLFCDGL